MTINLIIKLRKLTDYWRQAAEKTRALTEETPVPLIRGHMHGVSDGLTVAADDVDTLLDKPDDEAPA